jgi:hypothetical protein
VANSLSIKPSKDPGILTVQGDVSGQATADRIMSQAVDRFGRVDTRTSAGRSPPRPAGAPGYPAPTATVREAAAKAGPARADSDDLESRAALSASPAPGILAQHTPRRRRPD